MIQNFEVALNYFLLFTFSLRGLALSHLGQLPYSGREALPNDTTVTLCNEDTAMKIRLQDMQSVISAGRKKRVLQ